MVGQAYHGPPATGKNIGCLRSGQTCVRTHSRKEDRQPTRRTRGERQIKGAWQTPRYASGVGGGNTGARTGYGQETPPAKGKNEGIGSQHSIQQTCLVSVRLVSAALSVSPHPSAS